MKELVGKFAPLRSSLDIGAQALKRKVGTGAEFLKELMALPGVKPTELKERGLEALMNEPKMTHQEFVRHLMMKPPPRLQEKMLEGVNDDHIIKLIEQDAREAAREELGRPNARNAEEYENFLESFIDNAYNFDWNQYRDKADELVREGMLSGTPVHHEYTLPGGENYREMLIKKPGKDVFSVPHHYNDEPNIIASMRLSDRKGPNNEKLLHLEELQSDWHQEGREKGYRSNALEEEARNAYNAQEHNAVPFDELRPEDRAYEIKKYKESRVPDAPFKKNWEEMAIKRLIHHAAEKGYHGIVMTPGQEQADRYNLAKYINDVQYDPKVKHLTAQGKKGEAINKIAEPNELPNYVGKDIAEKLLQTELNQGRHKLSGIDLQTGGEGMKGFYDKKVPNIFNAVGKKHGVKMNLHGHQENLPRVSIFGEQPQETRTTQLHHFPITEPMREDVLKNGLPLYNHGGIVHKAEGGNVQPSIEQMRMALNQNKFMVPKSDIQSIGANEAPNMPYKLYVEPGRDGNPAVGGVDMNALQPGMQLMKQDQPPMTAPNQQGGNNSNPLGGAPTSPLGAPPSNILQMTPQGQALGAMTPPQPPQPPQRLASGGQPKGFLKSTPKKPHPLVGTRHKATSQGNLAQRIAFDLFKHEGKGSIVPVPYDATSRDNLVTHVSGHRLRRPLLTEAGFDYSMDPSHIAQQIGGASGLQIAGRVQDRINQSGKEHGENVFLLPNTMGENAENFSHHPAHIILDLMKQRKLEPHILDALTHDLRSQHELVEDKDTKKKYRVYPYQNFVGFGHPKMEEQIMSGGHGLDTSAGNLRKKLMDRLGGVNMQKLLDYNLADLKGAILDPDLATDPKGYMGRTVVRAQPGAPLRLSKHGSYDTDYTGKYQGSMPNRPIELLMPDIYSNIHTELTGLKKNKDKTEPQMRAQVVGAIEKRKQKIAQPINARVINNAGLYEEGLKQGEFDPKNLDSVLAYFSRKGGFKKGGKVETSLDTMRYALSKQKKAKK